MNRISFTPTVTFAPALVGAALVMLFAAGSAHACSCVQPDVAKRIKHVDAAIEAKVLRVREASFDPAPDGTYKQGWFKARVLRVHKGPERLRKSETVKIFTGEAFNSCAWQPRKGAKLGLMLNRRGRGWEGGICDVTSRKALRKGAGKARAASCGPR